MAESTSLDWVLARLTEFGITEEDATAVSSIGYVTRVMADYMDQIDYRSIDDKKEKFLTTATKLSSLYKHARKEGIEPDKASSSTLPIYLYVFLDDLAEADLVDSATNKRQLTIATDTVFKLGTAYKFKLDYPINVYQYGTDADTKYYATYDMSINNPVSDITASTISVRKYVKNNKSCLLLSLDIRDYIIETAEIGYIGPSASATFNVAYSDYIQYIECKYKDPDDSTYRNIATAMFFDKAVDSETIFYVIKDNVVAFANKYKSGRFDPINGGRFKFNIYTTKCITFDEYTGNTSLTLSDDADYNLDFDVAGGATGGKTPMTKDELRTHIKKFNSTNNALITASDVETYLNTYTESDSMYSSYKYIDSFNDRIYNIVMRLGTESDMLPTNTVDLKINEDYAKKYSLGRFLTFDTDQEFVGVKDSSGNTFVISKAQFLNDATYASYDKTDYISYALPYQLCYDRKYNLVTTFEKTVNRVIALLYTYVESIAYTYTCTGLTQKYLLDYDDSNEYYELNYTLTPSNSDMYKLIHSTSTSTNGISELNDLGYLKAIAVFHVNGVPIGYMPSSIGEYDETAKVYNMKTFMRMNSPIYFSYLDVTLYNMNHEATDMTLNMNTVSVTLVLYRNNSGYTDNTNQAKYPIFPDYSIVNIFDTIDNGDNDTKLFREISTYIPTQINDKILKTSNVSSTNPYGAMYEIVLDKIPFIAYNYYEANQEDVSSKLNAELTLLAKLYKKVEGTFKLRMNFVNTYGYSNRLMIGLDGRSIGTTHVSMEINLRKVTGSELTDSEIATYINTYFSGIDFKSGKKFHFIKLAKAAMTQYPDIELIELKSVNGFTSDNQYIYMKDYDSVLFIPEIANIDKDSDDNLKVTIINV